MANVTKVTSNRSLGRNLQNFKESILKNNGQKKLMSCRAHINSSF